MSGRDEYEEMDEDREKFKMVVPTRETGQDGRSKNKMFTSTWSVNKLIEMVVTFITNIQDGHVFIQKNRMIVQH